MPVSTVNPTNTVSPNLPEPYVNGTPSWPGDEQPSDIVYAGGANGMSTAGEMEEIVDDLNTTMTTLSDLLNAFNNFVALSNNRRLTENA